MTTKKDDISVNDHVVDGSGHWSPNIPKSPTTTPESTKVIKVGKKKRPTEEDKSLEPLTKKKKKTSKAKDVTPGSSPGTPVKACQVLHDGCLPYSVIYQTRANIYGVYKIAYKGDAIYVGNPSSNVIKQLKRHFSKEGNKEFQSFLSGLTEDAKKSVTVFWLDETEYDHKCGKSYLKCIEKLQGCKPVCNGYTKKASSAKDMSADEVPRKEITPSPLTKASPAGPDDQELKRDESSWRNDMDLDEMDDGVTISSSKQSPDWSDDSIKKESSTIPQKFPIVPQTLVDPQKSTIGPQKSFVVSQTSPERPQAPSSIRPIDQPVVYATSRQPIHTSESVKKVTSFSNRKGSVRRVKAKSSRKRSMDADSSTWSVWSVVKRIGSAAWRTVFGD